MSEETNNKLRENLKEAGYSYFWKNSVSLDGEFSVEDLKTVIRLLEEGWVDE